MNDSTVENLPQLEGKTRDADPILDAPPAMRSKVDADRLLALLDELERENGL
jgi:hypothetical protein